MYIVVVIGSSLYLTSATFMFWRVKSFHSSTETDPSPLTDLGGKSELILKPFMDEVFALVSLFSLNALNWCTCMSASNCRVCVV